VKENGHGRSHTAAIPNNIQNDQKYSRNGSLYKGVTFNATHPPSSNIMPTILNIIWHIHSFTNTYTHVVTKD